jgi:hypothetical protein
VLEPLPWPQSTVTPFALNELVNGGLLAPVGEEMYPAWMVPPVLDREPNPPHGYIISFIWLNERGFTAPASHFMRGLCYHYGVELHNFTPIPYRRRPASSPSAKDSWGSQRAGISRFTSSMWNSTPSRRTRRGYVRWFAPVA